MAIDILHLKTKRANKTVSFVKEHLEVLRNNGISVSATLVSLLEKFIVENGLRGNSKIAAQESTWQPGPNDSPISEDEYS